MNIKNINALSEQLKELGFSDLTFPLVKRMCFRPKRFSVGYRVEKNDNILNCQLLFESQTGGDYTFIYYDAAFQPRRDYYAIVNNVDVKLLTARMSEIDWKRAFDFTEKKLVPLTEKNVFENELVVAGIVDELAALASTNEGKEVVAKLTEMYWASLPYTQVVGSNLVGMKSKIEISQRFYVMQGQAGISVDDAYRYLQNRWLEKEMLAKRKQADRNNDESNEANSFGTELLKKKHRRRTKVSK